MENGKHLIPNPDASALINDPYAESQALSPIPTLPQRPQIVILGNRGSGAVDFFQTLDEGIAARGHDPEEYLTWTRNVDCLKDAFFGTRYLISRQAGPQRPNEIATLATQNEVIPFPNQTVPKTRPLGVVAFEKMRRYDMYGGGDIPTPFDELELMCEQYDVPLWHANRVDPDELQKKINDILSPATLLPAQLDTDNR